MRVSSVRLMRTLRVLLAVLVLAGVEVRVVLAPTAPGVYPPKWGPCYGGGGEGGCPAGKILNPSPKDFVSALNGKGDDWIAKVIAQGGPAGGLSAAMPASSGLSDDQLKDLVQYVKKLSS